MPGLAEHSFNVDQLENARALDGHLKSLAGRPETVARNTVVVAGGPRVGDLYIGVCATAVALWFPPVLGGILFFATQSEALQARAGQSPAQASVPSR